MTEHLDVQEFLSGYLAEAEEHLSSANANLIAIDEALQRKEANPRAVRELFRSLHTLKGLSAMVEAEPIVEIAHELETLLRNADLAGGRLPDSALDLVLRGIKAIEERVASLGKGQALSPAPRALLESLASLRVEEGEARTQVALKLEPELLSKLSSSEKEQLQLGISRGRRLVRVDFMPSPERVAQGLHITSVRHALSELGELVKVIPRPLALEPGKPGGVAFVLLLLTDAGNAAVATAVGGQPGDVQPLHEPVAAPLGEAGDELDSPDPQRRNFLRVDVARLDDALERLSALVVTRSRLTLALSAMERGTGDLAQIKAIANENGRQLRDLRGAIMRARMVRVSDLLERAPLIVRGLSRSSKKPIRLTVDAGQVELDKAVADQLFPAIVHLLRNAVDHGIEPAEERLAKGKVAEGHISIRCFERAGNQLELVVTDDGRGVDRAKLARRAGQAVPETDAQALDLITQSGLSTLEQATQTSGRGVGMDIVKRIAVNQLGGSLKLSSVAGISTSFTLQVPLSITILDGLLFVSGKETFVVPVSAVHDLTEIDPAKVIRTPDLHASAISSKMLDYRGSAVPLFQLSALLGVAAAEVERPKAIILRSDADTYALQVERMLGQQEVVVRPLRDRLVEVAGVTGSTDLGDGYPTLVLDLLGMVRSQLNRRAAVR